MDKDRVEGKVKDVAGRVQRQVGEWTRPATCFTFPSTLSLSIMIPPSPD